MGGVAKGIGHLAGQIGKIASPVIGMLPGGNYINMGIGALSHLGGGGGGAGNANLGGDMGALMQAMGAVGQVGQGQGGGMMDWIKNNPALTGLLGATLLGGGNPLAGINKAIDPRALNDPRQNATNNFAQAITDALKNGGSVGDALAKISMGPAYGGQLNSGANAGQTAAVTDANSALAQWFGSGGAAGATDNMDRIASGGQNLNLPPEIAALIGGGSSSQGIMDQIQTLIGQQNPALSALLNPTASSPEQSMLQQLAASGNNPFIGQADPNSPTGSIAALMQSPQAMALLNGGQGNDLNSIASAVSAAQQPTLDRRLRDLREQFSFNGLRDSTDLNSAAAQATAESQSSLQGILAQLAPQIAQNQNQTSLGALTALSGLGSTAANANNNQIATIGDILSRSGSLGQGAQGLNLQSLTAGGNLASNQQGNVLQALTNLFQTNAGTGNQAASILAGMFNNQQSNATQAALAQPGAASQMAQLPQILANLNLGMNTTMQNQGQNDLTRAYNAWLQQQSMAPNILSFLNNTGAQQYAPSLLSQGTNLALAGAALKQSK